MSKLEHLAERAPEIIDSLEKRADALDQRLTKLESRGDQTFGKWEGHLDAQEKAIGVAENAINKLSNVPLADSTTDAKKDPFRQPGTGDGANKGDDKKAQ